MIDFQDTLYSLVKNEITQFTSKSDDSDFYGCFFDCNSENGEVYLGFNTVSALEYSSHNFSDIEISNFKAVGMDLPEIDPIKRLAELRWSVADWKFHGTSDRFVGHIYEEEWEESWEEISEEISDYIIDQDDDDWDKAMKCFIDGVVIVAERLIKDGVFEKLARTDDFKVVVSDHDVCDEDMVFIDYKKYSDQQ